MKETKKEKAYVDRPFPGCQSRVSLGPVALSYVCGQWNVLSSSGRF